MLRAVTFDLWQTLILDRPEGLRQPRAGRVQGIYDILVRHGYAVQRDDVERAYDAVGEHLETLWKMQRDVGTRGQVRILLECLGLDGVVSGDDRIMSALDEAYCLPILSALPVANTGAGEVLEALSTRSLALALICNTGRTPGSMLRIVLERLGLSRYLTILTFSDEVGLRKPHPDIFAAALQALEHVVAQDKIQSHAQSHWRAVCHAPRQIRRKAEFRTDLKATHHENPFSGQKSIRIQIAV